MSVKVCRNVNDNIFRFKSEEEVEATFTHLKLECLYFICLFARYFNQTKNGALAFAGGLAVSDSVSRNCGSIVTAGGIGNPKNATQPLSSNGGTITTIGGLGISKPIKINLENVKIFKTIDGNDISKSVNFVAKTTSKRHRSSGGSFISSGGAAITKSFYIPKE